VVSATVDKKACCVYNRTEQFTYQLLIKLVISQISMSISNCNNGSTVN
jgi:hypothetical protein